jgi:hypothetical protein
MVNINYVQTSLQACMKWPKKSSTLRILILTLLTFITLMKTQFASKVVTFEQCLAYRAIIIMCYSCQTKALTNWIPSKQTWTIVKAICVCMCV